MFSSVWNFMKRHKRKLFFSSAFIGGVILLGKYARKKIQDYQDVILLGKYARKKIQDYQDQEAEECLAHARRQHHFDSNQRTCNMTVLSMLPSLRETVMRLLDTEKLTSQLKDKPANKLEIWEDLKIMSFSRTVLAVYSCCLLSVFLRVQLNIIGGYMYIDSVVTKDGTSAGENVLATPDIQQKYLALVQHLMDKGLSDLSDHILQTVAVHLKDISLKQQLCLPEIQQLINKIRKDVEGDQGNGFIRDSSSLMKYLIPQEETEQAACLTKMDLTLRQLTSETRDMLESSDFQNVLNDCLFTGFTRLTDRLAEYFKSTDLEGESITSPNRIAIPLAKVIPIMNGLIHTVLADAPNTFIQELLVKEQVKDFAANVYEAFSQPLQQSP